MNAAEHALVFVPWNLLRATVSIVNASPKHGAVGRGPRRQNHAVAAASFAYLGSDHRPALRRGRDLIPQRLRAASQAAGNVLLLSLLIMGLCASYVAVRKSPMNNVFGGMLTFHFVATARSTARRGADESDTLDWVALLWAVAWGAILLTLGLLEVNGEGAPQTAVPVGMHFFIGSGVAARSRRCCSEARARRHFREATAHPPSLEQGFWTVHRHLVLARGTAASLPQADPQAAPTGSARDPALPTHDLLAFAGLIRPTMVRGLTFHEARDAPVRDLMRQQAGNKRRVPTISRPFIRLQQ